MGLKDTMRGLGCLAKGAGCLLLLAAVAVLVPLLLTGGFWYIYGFVYEHLEYFGMAIGAVVLVAIVVIVLRVANEIGKDSN